MKNKKEIPFISFSNDELNNSDPSLSKHVKELPFISFSNDELNNSLPKYVKELPCPNCGDNHIVEYGTDEAGNLTKTLGFVTCPQSKETYVVSLNGTPLPLKSQRNTMNTKNTKYINLNTASEDEQIVAIKKDPEALHYIDNPSEAVCLAAIKEHPTTFLFMREQTPFLCRAIVTHKTFADGIQYVREQTPELCELAIRKDSFALRWVREQTEALCLLAIEVGGGRALRYVRNQTEAICLAAVRHNWSAIIDVHDQTEAICLEVVKQSGYALQYIRNQSEAICLAAVTKESHALPYVHNQTKAICLAAAKQAKSSMKYIRDPELAKEVAYELVPESAGIQGNPNAITLNP